MNTSARIFFFPVYTDFEDIHCLSHVVESLDNEQAQFSRLMGQQQSSNVNNDLSKRHKNLNFYALVDLVCKQAIFGNFIAFPYENAYYETVYNNILKESKSFLYMESENIYYGEMFKCKITPNGNLVILIREGFLNFLSGNKDQIYRLVLECSRLMYDSGITVSDLCLHSLMSACLKYNQHPEMLRFAALEIASFSVKGVNQ